MARKRKSKAECPAIPPHYVDESCDCRARVECPQAGSPGHFQCGICSSCGYPSFQGCLESCSRYGEFLADRRRRSEEAAELAWQELVREAERLE